MNQLSEALLTAIFCHQEGEAVLFFLELKGYPIYDHRLKSDCSCQKLLASMDSFKRVRRDSLIGALHLLAEPRSFTRKDRETNTGEDDVDSYAGKAF